MGGVYKFLNSKLASWLSISVAIIYRVINLNYVWFAGRDKIMVGQQSLNFLSGKGICIAKYFAENPDMPIYDCTPYWPPGYSVLLAPFLKIFNNDLYFATISIDIIAGIGLILLTRKIVLLLSFPVVAANIITLITGCHEYLFIYESLPTDLPAIVLFLAGLLFFIQSFQTEKNANIRLFISSIFLFLPCVFRYSYPPLSVAVPFAFILYGWLLKKKKYIRSGAICFIIVSSLIVLFFFFLKKLSGSAGYIVNLGRGFYPANIIHWTPFVLESFINSHFTLIQLVNKGGFSIAQSQQIMELVNVFLIISLLSLLNINFFNNRETRKDNTINQFLVIGFFVSLATCISLAYLSITYKSQPSWGNYVNEGRYFAFINLFLQCAFVGWIFRSTNWKKSLFKKVLTFGLSSLLLIEISHNIYFHTKVLLYPDKYNAAPFEEPDYTYFFKLAEGFNKNYTDSQLWVISDYDVDFLLTATFFGHKGIYDGFKVLEKPLKVKKKTILILPLYDPQLPEYSQFLFLHKAQFLERINEVNFYRIVLYPDKK